MNLIIMSNEKKFNKIAHRINTIKEMIKDKCVDSIVDFESENHDDKNVAS